MDELLDRVPTWISMEMNEFLTKEFTAEEVKSALDSIDDLKAPRIDGMPAIFFKRK